jgi:hypothetical protein
MLSADTSSWGAILNLSGLSMTGVAWNISRVSFEHLRDELSLFLLQKD